MDSEITADQLRKHVFHLAETIGERNVYRPQALHAAEEYIRQVWRNMGYAVVSQEYTAKGVRSANLEITRPSSVQSGSTQSEQIILIGAHYDSVHGSPGANDNGSGVAALLELSRLFTGIEPTKTVRFVAFTNEEPPFFYLGKQGSLVYAREARRRSDNIRLMIALETIGSYSDKPGSQSYPPLFRFFYPNRANFVAFVSNFRSRRVMRKLAGAFRSSTGFPMEHVATFAAIPGVAWSDHMSFWRKGYRALMVTDTAFYRYPYYHTSQDTPEKLNYEEFTKMTNGLFKALVLLAEQDL
ncbi:MAG: M28 family metallopeptidase [Gammaproteobacteria bacterium]|nr:MAG: M28 family metallopeptidase [Gammaproteobacteria bacterium]